jgi:hypothetical protein
LNHTQNRTKEQLIALYRYWLRKRFDQSTLASMFDPSLNQIKISQFLTQIRNAIYKDFVPLFLGANKKLKFYLAHNNLT